MDGFANLLSSVIQNSGKTDMGKAANGDMTSIGKRFHNFFSILANKPIIGNNN